MSTHFFPEVDVSESGLLWGPTCVEFGLFIKRIHRYICIFLRQDRDFWLSESHGLRQDQEYFFLDLEV